ncbi:MAG: RecQ family ATP-dependent DNA helicase [Planctomycetota bacterium]
MRVPPEALRRCLGERFGFAGFRPGQEDAIAAVCGGRNLISVMPTGSGKSLCYQLPALLLPGVTLVVSPLIALMKDQTDDLAVRGIPATFVNSSISSEEQARRLQAIRSGKHKLLYVAPERFQSRMFLDMIARVRISLLAVDEAHCVSTWGHDFRPDYLRIRRFMDLMGRPPVACFTATATPRVQGDIARQLGLTDVETLVRGFDRENLFMSVKRVSVDGDKEDFLGEFFARKKGNGIVYVGTRKRTEEVADFLNAIGVVALPYHAGMESEERDKVQDAFMGDKIRVIVATIAFGMGIDKHDVRFVIHYNLPGSIEAYYQEAGRAGRDGERADCVLLYAPTDIFLRRYFIDLNYPTRDQIQAVYETLYSLGENPILRTYREIGEKAAADIPEGTVGSCLRILRDAGVVEPMSASDFQAHLTTSAPMSALREHFTGSVQAKVLAGLASLLDLDAPGRFAFAIEDLCRAAGLDSDQIYRALNAMSQSELFSYSPPFRGKGVVLLQEKQPFEKVPIDWKHLSERRAYEEEKLEAMINYANSSHCRRKLILEYFGENTSAHKCAGCDNCSTPGRPARTRPDRGEPKAPPPRQPKHIERGAYGDPELAILRCVNELRRPLGKTKIVQIVNGSQANWILDAHLDRLLSYGASCMGQDYLTRQIDRLIAKGCLKQSKGDYPTVSLTEHGMAMLAAAESKPEPEPEPEPEEAPVKEPKSGISRMTSAREILAASVTRLCAEDRDGAKKALEELRCFKPDLVNPELRRRFDAVADARTRARIAWAMGELGEGADRDLLVRCLADSDASVRLYAIKAIAEISDVAALPKLREIAGNPSETDYNRKTARAALKQLGKTTK